MTSVFAAPIPATKKGKGSTNSVKSNKLALPDSAVSDGAAAKAQRMRPARELSKTDAAGHSGFELPKDTAESAQKMRPAAESSKSSGKSQMGPPDADKMVQTLRTVNQVSQQLSTANLMVSLTNTMKTVQKAVDDAAKKAAPK
ncbi:hypothetical protein GGI12_006066 [Dipsacomyces acuminosporus]|nr:hypothetical protein GGI12_006066 [Dipsacomyces acuminosporus]